MLSLPSRDFARAAVALLVAACAAILPAPAAPIRTDPAADEKLMETLWVELEKGEEPATRALLRMADRPKVAVAFLKEKMRPLKVDAKRVRELLADLGSDKEDVWKPAFEELEYLDPRLAIDLVTLMNEVTKAPARQRMVEVMSGRPAESLSGKDVRLRAVGKGEGYNFFAEGSWWAEHRVAHINSTPWGNAKKKWTRALRAVVLLEHLGTPDALAVLKVMASGHPDAIPTKAAKEAVERLTRKGR
jgi:hypothetical protein